MKNEILKRIISSIILIPLTFFLIIEGSYFFYAFLVLILIISCYEWKNISKNKSYLYFGYLFLLFSIFSVFQIRFNFGNNYLPLFTITMICIFTDVGGYVFGKVFKGPKLIKYSPNKTYSGSVGSFIFALCMTPLIIKYQLINFVNVSQLIIFILIISLVSQIGDIIISYYKRVANMKDTGNLIPGHGGLLDRIDGMLFVFPVSYLFMLTNFLIK